MITQEYLKEILEYDPDIRKFRWLIAPNGRVKIGDIAGSLHHSGYWYIGINRKDYAEHRLIWLHCYGEFPENFIDHIDGNRSNNEISNLRTCNRQENNRNVGIRESNTSGFKGVSLYRDKVRYIAQIMLEGKKTHLGIYSTPEEASEVYQASAKLHHGEFYRDTTKQE